MFQCVISRGCQVLLTCIDVPLQQRYRFVHIRRFGAARTSAKMEMGGFDLGSSPAPYASTVAANES